MNNDLNSQKSSLDYYKQVFDIIDVDKQGSLELLGIEKALKKIGHPISEKDLKKRYNSDILQNSPVLITFKQFVEYSEQRQQQINELYEKLNLTAQNANKYIRTKDIRKILKELDLIASDEQIRMFKDQLNDKSEDFISKEEFQKFFADLPLVNPEALFDNFNHKIQLDDEFSLPKEIVDDTTDKNEQLFKLGAGAISGAISRTLTAPIDRLKLIMQMQNPGSKKIPMYQILLNIYNQSGIRGYFKGNGVNCIKIAPETSIKYFSFEYLTSKFFIDGSNLTMFERLISGGISGLVAQLIIYPLEITKTRFALCKDGQYRSIFDCMNKIIKYEGYLSLYSGLFPSLIGVFPYAAIDLGINSKLRDWKQGREPDIFVMLFCGMVSSSIGMLATAPINIVRTRLQGNGLLPQDQRYKGGIDRRTMQNEGILGFYRGLIPSMMKVLPATSISYTIYGYITTRYKSN